MINHSPMPCLGKHPYPSRRIAETALRNLRTSAKFKHKNAEKKRSLANLTVYLCQSCHAFHIGGSYSPKKVTK